MAYNPHRFETLYGFSLLDEVHNFFPELLYDDNLFPSLTMRWMRHRVSTLFPQEFIRNRNLYRIYEAESRQNAFTIWHNNHVMPASMPAPVTMSSTPISMPSGSGGGGAATASAAAAAGRTNRMPTPAPGYTTRRRQQPFDSLQSPLFSLFWDMRDTTGQDTQVDGILNLLNLAFQDVVITPTAEQISAASRIVNIEEIPDETICSICQEHDSNDSTWRELHCGHKYHKNCIDIWLRSHVQCPVCRADIRTLAQTRQPQPQQQTQDETPSSTP
jgi:hypothetical protein